MTPAPSGLRPRRFAVASRAVLRASALAFALLLGAGCAQLPPSPPADGEALFDDALFPPATVAADPQAVYAMTPAMRELAERIRSSHGGPQHDPRRALLAALYDGRQLRLRYDAADTRTASEAFEARAGNCLSLVIMTAAFARHLGLPVSYRQVDVDESYLRWGDLTFASGHVNLVLARSAVQRLALHGGGGDDELLVDFLPADELRGQRGKPLEERTIVAMYFNNRAAETLAEGRTGAAYAWLRAALRQDPAFDAAINTLAVLYARAGHPVRAEAALRHVLARDPDHVAALTNLVGLLRAGGRQAEADAAAARLARVQPDPPFRHYESGRRALDAGDDATARAEFDAELRRRPEQPEVHFWAAIAALRLGDGGSARQHLEKAVEHSPTQHARQLYTAKLERLRSLPPQ